MTLASSFTLSLPFYLIVNKVSTKRFARVNMLLKCFYSNDRNLQCKLFSAFDRRILECNLPIWSPHLAKDIKAIECVQKNFNKNLKGLRNKP